MPVFHALGREWLVKIDAPKSMAVRSELGVNLTPRVNEEFDVRSLTDDPELLPQVLWSLVRTQAGSIERDAFLEAITGDVAESAGVALAEAIVDFIPSRSRREALRAALKHDREALAAGMELTVAQVEQMAPTQKAAILEQVRQVFERQTTLLRRAMASPAPSDAPPTGEPGESSSGCSAVSSEPSDAT